MLDSVKCLSEIWTGWCQENDIPKGLNDDFLSADDLMSDEIWHGNLSSKQIKFIDAFIDVWEEINGQFRNYCKYISEHYIFCDALCSRYNCAILGGRR